MEQNFNPGLALIGLSGTGLSGLNQIALRALCQRSFCRIRRFNRSQFFLTVFIELIKDKFYNVI